MKWTRLNKYFQHVEIILIFSKFYINAFCRGYVKCKCKVLFFTMHGIITYIIYVVFIYGYNRNTHVSRNKNISNIFFYVQIFPLHCLVFFFPLYFYISLRIVSFLINCKLKYDTYHSVVENFLNFWFRINYFCTVWPRSNDPFYVLTYFIQ